nr:GHKL domain-containing protein [uncultured Cellulosilyticum sp.]
MSSKRNLMILALALIYLCVIATTDYTLKNGSGIVTKSVFPLLGIYIVAIGGAWCVLMSHHSIKAVYEDKENTLQRNFFKKHLRIYAQINKIEKEQESLKQEATQGVNALLEAVDEEKLEELKPLVEKIEDKMKSCKPYIITGNTMLDMVINEKYDTACKHNVEMKVNISLPEKTGMGTVDLCMLLGNTLDYALERCERIGEEREKSISVEGVWYKGYLMFKLYYTTPKEALDKAENNSNKLIKKAIEQDPYGMGSVIKHIRKYEGELSLQECGWGEEKLTFSLNAANSYSKVFGY